MDSDMIRLCGQLFECSDQIIDTIKEFCFFVDDRLECLFHE